jgi:hypothetical protein
MSGSTARGGSTLPSATACGSYQRAAACRPEFRGRCFPQDRLLEEKKTADPQMEARTRNSQDSPLEGTGFKPLVPQKALGALHVGSPNLKSPSRATSQRYVQVIDIMLNVGRASGTDGSNPVPSSGESLSRGISPSDD